MNDRFTRGFLAGPIAGILPFLLNLTASGLGLGIRNWLDFAGVLIFGGLPQSLGEKIFASAGVFFFEAILGAVFAYIITSINSDNYLLKGWAYGITVWFAAYSLTVLFDVPVISDIKLVTAIVNFIGASLWGLSLAFLLRRFDLQPTHTSD